MSLQRSPWRWMPYFQRKKWIPSLGRSLTTTVPQILLSNALVKEGIYHDMEYPLLVECGDGKRRMYFPDIFIQPPPFEPPDLAVEVDGSSHSGRRLDYDAKRKLDLENAGIHVISFTNYEVYKKRKWVIDRIVEELK